MQETIHSTQKPVERMRRPLPNNSNVGQAIYEAFLRIGHDHDRVRKGRQDLSCHRTESGVRGYFAVARWQNFTGREGCPRKATDERSMSSLWNAVRSLHEWLAAASRSR